MRSLTAAELAKLDPATLRRPGTLEPGGMMATLLGGTRWEIPAPRLTGDLDSFPGPPIEPAYDEGPAFAAAADAYVEADAVANEPGRWLALALMGATLLMKNYAIPHETAFRLFPFAPSDELAETVQQANSGNHEASQILSQVAASARQVAEHVIHAPARRMNWLRGMFRAAL